MYDIAIIGAGITGCAIARELSAYELETALIDRENDVSVGTTKANSAILHAGYDPEPGTLMAKYNVRGNAMTRDYCRRMNVPLKECGSLVVAFTDGDAATLKKLYERGLENGVPDMSLLSGDEARALEKNLSQEVTGALLAKSAAIVSPWELCISLAENAVKNGVEFLPGFCVCSIKRIPGGFELSGGGRVLQAATVINAAGVHSGDVAAMAGEKDFNITPSKGSYYLLDKSAGNAFSRVIFQCPTAAGKGVLVSPTVHGNLIVGPDALPADPEDLSVTSEALSFVERTAKRSFPALNIRENIRNFAGMRANSDVDDFVIEERDGFINAAGIKSPGLTCAMAIAEDIAGRLAGERGFTKKQRVEELPRPLRFNVLSPEEKQKLIAKRREYGRVVCRCETVTEGEILDTFERPIPPVSIDGVKRRVNAGMGRCQGGFCGPRVHEILAKKLNIPPEEVVQDKEGMYITVRKDG